MSMENEQKINVLQLVEGFNLGGAEKKLLELVRMMNRDQFNTIVCSLGLGDEIKDQFEALNDYGIEVMTIHRNRKIDFGLVLKIAKLIKERSIHVVMTTLFYADVIGPLAGKLGGAKAVFSWETISSPKWLVFHRLMAYKLAIKLCTKVISVSNATAEYLHELRGVPKEKIHIIPYGVDLQKYIPKNGRSLKESLGVPEGCKTVGLVGRLHEQKGHVYLIEAAQKIVKEFPNVRFLFAGDGELRETLQKQVNDLNLQSYFNFLGFRHDIPELLQSFDIFTLPSLYEGLPNVVLEAMASSLPVVATPVDGTKEAVIPEETGSLVPEKNPDVLADSIIRLLKNEELAKKYGNAGRKRVEDYFSLEGQISQFEDLYRNVVLN